MWEPEQLDQAWARFAELSRSPLSRIATGEGSHGESSGSTEIKSGTPHLHPLPAAVRGEETPASTKEAKSIPPPAPPDPLRIPPNAACRARDHVRKALEAQDWETARSLVRDDFIYEDRRKHALVTGDVEVLIKSTQEGSSWPGIRVANALLATAGDRIML